MWLVDPTKMCRQHLIGEHLEMHMFAGAILKEKRVQGYMDKGLLDPRLINERHDALAAEMVRRGYVHTSPLTFVGIAGLGINQGHVDAEASFVELKRRCAACRARA
jgi:hypothetical protein